MKITEIGEGWVKGIKLTPEESDNEHFKMIAYVPKWWGHRPPTVTVYAYKEKHLPDKKNPLLQNGSCTSFSEGGNESPGHSDLHALFGDNSIEAGPHVHLAPQNQEDLKQWVTEVIQQILGKKDSRIEDQLNDLWGDLY